MQCEFLIGLDIGELCFGAREDFLLLQYVQRGSDAVSMALLLQVQHYLVEVDLFLQYPVFFPQRFQPQPVFHDRRAQCDGGGSYIFQACLRFQIVRPVTRPVLPPDIELITGGSP